MGVSSQKTAHDVVAGAVDALVLEESTCARAPYEGGKYKQRLHAFAKCLTLLI